MEEIRCPITEAIEIVSKRWTILIISKLLEGPKRFSEMVSEITISNRLLSERLKELESVGIVSRTIFAEIPVRVEYELTPKGKALKPILRDFHQWAVEWNGGDCATADKPVNKDTAKD